MFCCEEKSTVSDLANDLKKAALQEVKQKKITSNIYFLTRCANPYAIDGLVIADDHKGQKVYHCGKLMFHMVGADLKKYICGSWSNTISNEVQTIKNQRNSVKRQDELQTIANEFAVQNYVI